MSGQWLLLAEAAKELGVTTMALRKRAKRGQYQLTRNNSGHLLVWLEAVRQNVDNVDIAKNVGNPILADHVVHVVGKARHTDADVARMLAERDTLHSDLVGKLLAQHGIERSLWLERIDVAELRAERAEQRLDQIVDDFVKQSRLSWWQRLFG